MTKEYVGPYRLDELIGSGGMGTVFKAWDSRLERWVAVKRILPSRELSADRLERFRREARSNAGINHHAVAQVFDIISEGDRDHIIMELVEGTTLHEILEGGPLTPERTVFLGHQISEGLSAAHALGLIHRDLKAANVMVTKQYRAKILDFGLAKIIEPSPDAPELTEEGMVIGTCRAMSPEQAEGKKLDHRSDLFALGSLLFQMVTGTHPFAGNTPIATLRRIVYEEAPLTSTLNPDVPVQLSNLIARLLSKSIDDRPTDANEVAEELMSLSAIWTGATLAQEAAAYSSATVARFEKKQRTLWLSGGVIIVALIVAVASQWWTHRPVESTAVAVLKPEVIGTSESLSLSRDTLRGALLNGIASLDGLVVLDPKEVDSLEGSTVDIARAVSAQELVLSQIEGCDPLCKVQIRRLDASGQVFPGSVKNFDVLAEDLYLIATATTSNLLAIYNDRKQRQGFAKTEVDPEDFAAFIKVKQAWLSPEPGVIKQNILGEIVAIRRRSPRFLEAHLEEANAARYLFERTRSAEYLEQARDAIERALDLAPADTRSLAMAIDVAIATSDFEEAEKRLDELSALEPSDIRVISSRARLAMAQGDSATAISLFETAVRMRPSHRNFRHLALAEMRSGQMEKAKGHLREGLDLAPDNQFLKSKLGQFELVSGNFESARKIYSELAGYEEGEIYFSNLGLSLMMLRRFPEAIDALNKARDITNNHPSILLNLGDCFTLSGDKEKGREYYNLVLVAVDSDANMEGIDMLSARVQCLAHLGQPKEAIRVVQHELQLGPDNPQAHFDAAIVYAITGDRNAALVHKEKSIELGMAPAWLDLPWFDWLETGDR